MVYRHKTLEICFLFIFFFRINAHGGQSISNCPHEISNQTLLNDFDGLTLDWNTTMINQTVTNQQIRTMFALMNIALYNQTSFNWTYAENLNDGRGITFGIMQFKSGMFDGRRVLQQINKTAKSQGINHVLADYYLLFANIDNTPHDLWGNVSNVDGLENFISDWNKYGADPIAKQAQLDVIKQIYWNPMMQLARDQTINYTAALSQLFDICMNHGCNQDGYNNFGLSQLIGRANDNLAWNLKKRNILSWDERDWNKEISNQRKRLLDENSIWNDTRFYTRTEIQRRIVQTKNFNLTLPIEITCEDLYNAAEKIIVMATLLFYVVVLLI